MRVLAMVGGAGRGDNSGMQTRSLSDWLAYIERQHPKTIAMGLERVRVVADAMALPKPARFVVTVGGTNGKGSTVAFVEAIARAAGWRVGAYTSPHLLRYNERVRIDGAETDDASLIAAFDAVEVARGGIQDGGLPLTYFEYGTLAALWLFARSDLDLAVLEVGLGGRLDAVNIVDPDVAVVTTVDLDHQDWLGDTIEKIGFEKAGIARAWKPLILGDDDPPSSVLGHAYAIGASAIRIGCDFFFERIEGDDAHWRWREVGDESVLPMPRLTAPVQLRNAAVAIAALRALPVDLPRAWPMPAWRRGCSGSCAMVSRSWSMSVITHRPRAHWLHGLQRRRSQALPMRCSQRWPIRMRLAWCRRWQPGSTAGGWPGWPMRGRAGCRSRRSRIVSPVPPPRRGRSGRMWARPCAQCSRSRRPATGCWSSAPSIPLPQLCRRSSQTERSAMRSGSVAAGRGV
jgi:hypothetical protein